MIRFQWRNNEEDFKRWCSGTTGYQWSMQMRQLNETGYAQQSSYGGCQFSN
jgi:deoxyribodipyrimidine photolyase